MVYIHKFKEIQFTLPNNYHINNSLEKVGLKEVNREAAALIF